MHIKIPSNLMDQLIQREILATRLLQKKKRKTLTKLKGKNK
jgi:hypothetical protein